MIKKKLLGPKNTPFLSLKYIWNELIILLDDTVVEVLENWLSISLSGSLHNIKGGTYDVIDFQPWWHKCGSTIYF